MEAVSDTSKTLWMGDLEAWMDEHYIQSCLTSLGYGKELSAVKLIRDKATGLPLKYGFLEFTSHHSASSFYHNYNNRLIPSTSKQFKLNWAAYGSAKSPASKGGSSEIQVYVGDIDALVTEHKLLQFFKGRYPSAYMSKIITDPNTKASKGYGFVKFTSSEEAGKAIAEMNGQSLMGKVIKVSTAYSKAREEGEEESEGQLAARQKLYAQFYSSLNDPQMKAEYERQILKTFGSEDGRKASLKQSLQQVPALTYPQTLPSEQLLQVVPRWAASDSKYQTQRSIYQ